MSASRIGKGLLATMLVAAAALVYVAPASASTGAQVVYNNIKGVPGNSPSEAFEAQSASEFGGAVSLAGTARGPYPKVAFTLSSWGCEHGHWYSADCVTGNPLANVGVPITVNLYNVDGDNEPGSLIASNTRTFQIPYRPSASPSCTGADAGKWYESGSGTCFNGRQFSKRIGFGNITLPDEMIVSIAYDTTHYGYNPIGESAPCYTSDGGCIYDSLNVATNDASPAVGTQPLPDDAYLFASSGGAYCDGGSGGTGSFRLDAGCWTGYQPAFRIRIPNA